MVRTLLKSFIAVAVGNAVYFLLVYPHVPQGWQHKASGGVDAGLLLDFGICVIFYIVVRALWPDKGADEIRPRP